LSNSSRSRRTASAFPHSNIGCCQETDVQLPFRGQSFLNGLKISEQTALTVAPETGVRRRIGFGKNRIVLETGTC